MNINKMSTEKIKILLADDVRLLCEGMKALLAKDENIEIVGMAGNGLEAFNMAEKLSPDLILMDMKMPEYDGIYGTKMIKSVYKEVKILILTTFDDADTVKQAIAAGADGYVLKESSYEEIINVIYSVMGNKTVFDSKIFENIRNEMINGIGKKEQEDKRIHFTERELSIMRCIVDGKSNKEIAAELFISEGTVRNSISFIMEKVNVNDRTRLAVYAVKHNLA